MAEFLRGFLSSLFRRPEYRTAPVMTTGMPPGIPSIIANEAAERFNYYGMRSILVVFMTKYLRDRYGLLDVMVEEEARVWYHLFLSANYFFPVLGALLADAILGKYRTIFWLSIVYTVGSLVLALDQTRTGLTIGLTLISLGSGGIKPCVSANVGDQFGEQNSHLIDKIMNWFYMSINAGSAIAVVLTPWLLDNYGPTIAFGIPGVMMALATFIFWLGRKKYAHIKPGGMMFLKEISSKEGMMAALKVSAVFLFISVFFSLYDQSGGGWVLQAEKMDLMFIGIEWYSSQIQVVNPILIIFLVPIFNGFKLKKVEEERMVDGQTIEATYRFTFEGLYAKVNRIWKLTYLRKIGIGFVLTVPAFLVSAIIEDMIDAGQVPNIAWQIFGYVWLSAAEVFVSTTALAFAYTQAPPQMKSVIMALFLLSISLGNGITAGVNYVIQEDPAVVQVDAQGEYVLQIEVSDGELTTSDEVKITLIPNKSKAQIAKENAKRKEQQLKKKPLQASAGRVIAAPLGQEVNLFGSVDKMDSKGRLTYEWSLVLKPKDSSLISMELVGRTERVLRVTPDMEGEYEFQFMAWAEDRADGGAGRDFAEPSIVKVYVTNDNMAPVANAGPDQAFELKDMHEGEWMVTLNGAASFDPNGNGDELTYQWKVLSVPEGSSITTASIENPTQPTKTSILEGSAYYYFFIGLLAFATLLFIPVAMRYREKTYIQGTEEEASS